MPAFSKEFLDIQATIECGFTLKRVRDMIRTYSQFQAVFKMISKLFSCVSHNLANVYLFKFNNENFRKTYKICSKLTLKTPERRH